MASVLQSRTAAARQAREILRKQLRQGLKELDGEGTSDAHIHDARKRIKRARAILRLLRGALSRADYRREERMLRAAARPLSAARDAKILLEAFDGLPRQHRGARQTSGERRFRRELVHARREARRHALTDADGVPQARILMRKARAAAKDWPLRRASWRQLVQGAIQRYSQGRRALQEARREPSAELLHRWRKQAKYLYLQLELLAPFCAPFVARMAGELHRLSDDLGADHDLALLHDNAAARVRDFPDASHAIALLQVIEHSRSSLQRKALLQGRKLYRQRPAMLARTLGAQSIR